MFGAEHLHFACNGCGDCCRRHRVALTHFDLARLLGAVSGPAGALVDWLTPEVVDLDAESSSFVLLPPGPRLMVLAHGQRGCRFLSGDDRCGVYETRPRDCRAYPFVLERSDGGHVVRLALFDPAGCGDRAAEPSSRTELERADAERLRELEAFVGLVAHWNRFAKHRRRLGHAGWTPERFLSFALERASLGA